MDGHVRKNYIPPPSGWLGGAMVLGKLPVLGRPTIWITVGHGPTALTVGAGGGCLDIFTFIYLSPLWGWSGGEKVLGKLPKQGPIVLSVGAGGGCLDIFSLIYHFSFLSPSLWETARYRLEYCLKVLFKPTNQPNLSSFSLSLGDGLI